ncbi:hypothetical protein M569_11225, partial [Genlisea aurea]
MGTLIGHVGPGIGFTIIGLWHLYNNIKLHARNPKSFKSSPWFPAPGIRYLELYLIIAGTLASISMELFIGPDRHQPLDDDGTIPSNHLHNFEHSNISLAFLAYALLSVLLDRLSPPAKFELTHLLGAAALGQMLLLFHLHSADHMGVEGQYHWLLQIAIFVSLATALLGIRSPESFAVSFVRSASILFQGIWLAAMGIMLWTPRFIPKGCFMNLEEGHRVVRCRGDGALERAKSLVNIEFSWYVLGVVVFSTAFYLLLARKTEYRFLPELQTAEDDDDDDVEAQKK